MSKTIKFRRLSKKERERHFAKRAKEADKHMRKGIQGSIDFRTEAQQKKLIEPHGMVSPKLWRRGTRFYFALYRAHIAMANATPRKVRRLVAIAQKHADPYAMPEDGILLGLTADRKELKDGSFYANWEEKPLTPKRIELSKWLKQHDQDITQFLTKDGLRKSMFSDPAKAE